MVLYQVWPIAEKINLDKICTEMLQFYEDLVKIFIFSRCEAT